MLRGFKWPGSKAWLPSFLKLSGLSVDEDVYEPFVGSGAFFVNTGANRGVLADVNEEIVVCLQALRDRVDEVICYLSSLENTEHFFHSLKNLQFKHPAQRAARLIFLVNTSWGGMYRVNKQGLYNVPFGANGRPAFSAEALKSYSRRLQNCKIIAEGYNDFLRRYAGGGVLYIDPPYVGPSSGESVFNRYATGSFSWSDQIVLAKRLHTLAEQGAKVIVSQVASCEILQLYPGWTKLLVNRPSSLHHAFGRRSVRCEVVLLSGEISRLRHC